MSQMPAHIARLEKPQLNSKCKNCGRYGHKTQYCRSRPNTNTPINRQAEYKKTSPHEPTLLAIEESDKVTAAYAAPANKRMRIEEILNQSYPSQPTTRDPNKEDLNSSTISTTQHLHSTAPISHSPFNKPRQIGITPEQKKKPATKGSVATIHPLAERILQQPLPITVGEYLDARPNMAPVIIKGLQHLTKSKNTKKIAFVAEEKQENSTEELTYILGEIGNQSLPIFLDNGATYSLMHQNLTHHLELIPMNLPEPVFVRPIKGPPITITEYVETTIELEGYFRIDVNYRLIADGAVALLTGLKDLQKWGANINYKNETLTLFKDKDEVSLNLHSKESIGK
ncbi:hypothetical protein BB561_006024 [Smittium simulii]|uniref:CCHC-type domain-containing protein n=1 Tax=Smittium simulii TaxID=133385 RepID=A0A2T9Y738_9FUNG|nr:hypothetical protein BB561_006024 [Smittium simulii]